jgi:1,5-anhydro-D-fructose reductase (1,5-anhydro-D-mannitol-forming)
VTTVGWGIVGIGRIADSAMAPAIAALPECELVAVVSRDQGRADAFASKHGAKRAHTSYEEMLADPEVGAVLITTPNALHAEQALAARRAGKHVLCDKPLATSAAAAAEVVDAFRSAGLRLGINFQTRHHACFIETKGLLDAGTIGRVLLVQAEASAGAAPLRSWRTDPELAGLGTVFNIGVHVYDLLRYLLGAEVTEVAAMFDAGPEEGPETLALALLRFEGGAMAYVNANQSTPNYQADIDIYGTDGRIVGDQLTRPWQDGELRVLTEAGETATPYSNRDMYVRVVEEFARAVLEGRDPNPSGEDGLRSAQLTDAIARSAREGRVVRLDY